MVIQLRVPRKYHYFWLAATGAVVVASILTIIFDHSWRIAFAAALLALFAWIWGTSLTARRARGGTANELVLTPEGLRSPLFSLDWERVSRVWIGETSPQTAGLPALFIEPFHSSDVRWVRSRMIGANRWLAERTRGPQLQVLQTSIDLPLEHLVAAMERRAGRSLS